MCVVEQNKAAQSLGDQSPVQKAGMQMLLGRCTYFTFYFYRLTEIFLSDLDPGFSLSNVQSSIMVENGEKEHPLFPCFLPNNEHKS